MSFLHDVKTGFFFQYKSSESVGRSISNVSHSLSQIASPYYDLTSNVNALAYPFLHATQLLRDAARFVYGAFVLVGALSAGHVDVACNVTFSLLELVGAAILEVLNTVLAVISLATRLVASIFNLGYVSTSNQLCGAYFNGAEIGGRNMFMGMSLAMNNNVAEMNDALDYQYASTLI